MAPPVAELWRRYRVPIFIAGGGVIAYQAYTRSRAATVAAATAAAVQSPTAAGLTPEQVAGLMGQGGQLVIAGQAPLVGLAGQGLSVAGTAAGGAQLLAEVAVGNLGGAIGTLADLFGRVSGLILPPPPPPPYVPPPAPLPVAPPAPPPPAPSPTRTLYRYELQVGPGQFTEFIVDGSCRVTATYDTFGPNGSWAPVERMTCGSMVHWRITEGALRGISYVPGMTSGAWYINARYRWSDGRPDEYVNVGQSGS